MLARELFPFDERLQADAAHDILAVQVERRKCGHLLRALVMALVLLQAFHEPHDVVLSGAEGQDGEKGGGLDDSDVGLPFEG